MKITDIKTFAVDCFRTNWVFVKVYTDEGITGVGEATLEYKEKALIEIISKDVYKEDYIDITEKLLFETVSYEDALSALIRIRDSNLF